MLQGKNILITGGAGSIGSELVRQLCVENTVYFIDNNETGMFDLLEEMQQKGYSVKGILGDVRDKDTFNFIKTFKFDYVFHAAALKHVTPSAWFPDEYTKTNIFGTLNAIEYALKEGAILVNISTDKTVNANSIMSATKKVAELAVKNAGGISVRFGNVLGSRGSVVEIWSRQISRNEPLTVTDKNATRFMMTIPQAVSLVIKASEVGKSGEVLILDMGKKVNIYDLALEILGKAGSNVGIKMIGLRPGETLSEELMSEDEKRIAEKRDDFWVIKGG